MTFKRYSFLLFLLFGIQTLLAQEDNPLYRSEKLEIAQISPHTFVHVSYLSTQDFGKVACNGMLVIQGGEALVFDTPTNDEVSRELIDWLEKEKHVKVKAVVATHFHNDCLGGLNEFHGHRVPSFGSVQTQTLAKAAGDPVPQHGFEGQLILDVGGMEVVTRFFGEGHTRDNVVAYVPSDQVLFGGCLIKEIGATVGYLGDANTGAWSETVSRIKYTFSDVQRVIPGHGKIGNGALLDYTIRLFEGK
jgi:metallo-beta-lactamase class B